MNPAEMIRKSRDANRLSDLATLQQALTLYAEDQGSFSLASSGVTYFPLRDATANTIDGAASSSSTIRVGASGLIAY